MSSMGQDEERNRAQKEVDTESLRVSMETAVSNTKHLHEASAFFIPELDGFIL